MVDVFHIKVKEELIQWSNLDSSITSMDGVDEVFQAAFKRNEKRAGDLMDMFLPKRKSRASTVARTIKPALEGMDMAADDAIGALLVGRGSGYKPQKVQHHSDGSLKSSTTTVHQLASQTSTWLVKGKTHWLPHQKRLQPLLPIQLPR